MLVYPQKGCYLEVRESAVIAVFLEHSWW